MLFKLQCKKVILCFIVSQLKRYGRASFHYTDFISRIDLLIKKILVKQIYMRMKHQNKHIHLHELVVRYDLYISASDKFQKFYILKYQVNLICNISNCVIFPIVTFSHVVFSLKQETLSLSEHLYFYRVHVIYPVLICLFNILKVSIIIQLLFSQFAKEISSSLYHRDYYF